MRRLVLAALALLAGCGLGFGRSPVPAPVPPAGGEARGLEVTLLWAAPVDLDLYVTDPEQETVYFANRRSASGGRLVEDAACPPAGKEAPSGEVRETIRWQEPPPGRYRAGIDYIDRCGGEIVEVGYRLLVEAPGSRREATGTVRLSRFLYQALEFHLPSEDARMEGSR